MATTVPTIVAAPTAIPQRALVVVAHGGSRMGCGSSVMTEARAELLAFADDPIEMLVLTASPDETVLWLIRLPLPALELVSELILVMHQTVRMGCRSVSPDKGHARQREECVVGQVMTTGETGERV